MSRPISAARRNRCRHVLANLDKLVVKAVGESGGYGMLVGPHASKAEREAFAEKVKADPDNYIAQPTIQLSTAPTFVDGGVEPRHVDLRPFILHGERDHDRARRADPRRAQARQPGGQFAARAAARRTPGCS